MEKSIHLDDFIVITDSISELHDNYFLKEKNSNLSKIEKLEKQIKELSELLEKKNSFINNLETTLAKQKDDHHKLKKRHTELLRMMNELLKIKPSDNEVDNLDEIRDKIIKTLYNELRRHTVIPFTAMIGNYTHSKTPDL
jgi:DNA repair exonuclease SbcCD ATPase subunit